MHIALFAISAATIITVALIVWNLLERRQMQKNGESEYYMRNYTSSVAWESVLPSGIVVVILVLVVWGVIHFPLSSYNRSNCARIAEGYGLEYDWSIRSHCRLYLPSGQLVPEGRVRITSDGEIIVSGDDEG